MVVLTTVTAVTTVKYFLSTFRKRNLTHLTTDVMFSGPLFCDSHDVFCKEVA